MANPVTIVGAHGYGGRELARLLLRHPQVDLQQVFLRDPSWCLADDLPEQKAQQVKSYPVAELANAIGDFHTIFFATPPQASIELIAEYANTHAHLIDLSGGFRLPAEDYGTWYGFEHPAPELLSRAQFGLCPWWLPEKSSISPAIIANPGCYATSALMALVPLLKAGIVSDQTVVIDAKSGVTGAGRKAEQSLLFAELVGDFYPYKIAQHQHTPEICYYAQHFGGRAIDVMFTTHLLAIKRGISSAMYCQVADNVGEADIARVYQQAYQDYPLVKHGVANDKKLLSLQQVVGSARTHISYRVVHGHLYLFSCLDNLMKGAASQAVENMNVLLGLPYAEGLLEGEGLL